MLGGPQQHPNREETYFMTCTTFDLKSTPDITTPIRTIPTRIKNTPQNSVNQQHSNQQVEQSEQENIFTAFYQSTLESFLHSWENFSRFYCAATFSEFWRKIWCKIWWVLIDFSVGWNGDFLRRIWEIFGVLEASGILMNHLWDFPGLLDRAGWFWDLGARFISTRNKKFDFQSLWHTRNQKLKINEKKLIGPGLAEKRSSN